MFLKNLSAINFRNFNQLNLSFYEEKPINIFLSPNGMGKSNLLEMIYYLSYLRSFRNVSDKELILYGANSYHIECEYHHSITNNIIINYHINKELLFNHKKIKKYSELLGKLLTVLFCNEDIFIIKGVPSLRRKFFDIFISIFDNIYLQALKNYHQIIIQKNFLLKKQCKNDLISIYNQQLTDYIFYIMNKRNDIINLIDKDFQIYFSEIGLFKEKVKLIYSPSIKDKDLTKKSLFEILEQNVNKELNLGYSIIGPHLDNYYFFINGINFTKYASLGQTRLASLVLKLVQAEFYKKNLNIIPILLLDDVILELDKKKQENFFNFISHYQQVFITVTNKSFIELVNNKKLINEIEISYGRIK